MPPPPAAELPLIVLLLTVEHRAAVCALIADATAGVRRVATQHAVGDRQRLLMQLPNAAAVGVAMCQSQR